MATTNAWSLVDRARSVQPVYAQVLPVSAALFWLTVVARAGLLGAVAVVYALVVAPDRLLPGCALILVSLATAGVRRGQKVFLVQKDRANAVARLVGADPRDVYWRLTSAGLPYEVAVVLLVGLVAAASERGSGAVVVAATMTLGRVVGELVGHLACWSAGLQVPQYVYLPVAVAMSMVLIGSVGGRVALPVGGRLEGVGLVLVVMTLAGCALSTRLAGYACRERLAARALLPTFRGRRLPLPLRLWTVSDRQGTSLTLGLTLTVFLLVHFFVSLGLPALAGTPAYVVPELTCAVLYVAVYAAVLVLREPLGVDRLRRRQTLYRAVRLPGLAEARTLFRGVAAPVVVVVAALAAALAGGAGPYPLTDLAAYALVGTGATWAGFLGAVSGNGTAAAGDAPAPVLATTALPSLLAALLAVGYTSGRGTHDGLVDLAVAAALLLGCAAVHTAASHSVRKALS